MSILSAFREFRHDARGNVLMIFGLGVFAIVGAAGAALDMSDLQRMRTRFAGRRRYGGAQNHAAGR